jgi:hypothetical protein
MPQQSDTNTPNQASNKEKAEGSRENTNEGAGISNRPLEEEKARQENLPPRGESRDSVTHGRQSHVVNEGAADNARRDDADVDPVMPTGDSTLRTDI